ncbi:MAG: Calvin cycle protein CP12 [Leptolyngbyaceae bacterium]|nr:Calvin cycle protein CP12 [Leptolyngbyaceae bacterium]
MNISVIQDQTSPTIENRLDMAIGQAREECNLDSHSPFCATAWDIVEELQAEISHRQQAKPISAFERYCRDNPDTDECRIYDV